MSIWLYEIANWLVLAAQGYAVSLSTVGWIPLGVSAVTSAGLSPVTKLFQMTVAIGLLLPLRALLSTKRLILAEALTLSSVGIFLASGYWEMLSLLTAIPMTLHVGLFITGASAMAFVLLRQSNLGRPHHARTRPLPATGSALGIN
jgi:hypothetical protein